MKTLLLTVILCVGVMGAGGRAETTPMDQELPEEKETLIACELPAKARAGEGFGNEFEPAKGTYHYNLWLPAGYHAEPNRRWPCLFIASASGKAKMGAMASWLKSHRYVVVMLVESKNGPWAPITGNFLAAHDDVVKRVRIQEGLKMATGNSGGARASSVFVQLRPGFAGLIMQAAGAAPDDHGRYLLSGAKRNTNLYSVITMGDKDSNREEAQRVKAALGSSRLLTLSFKGGHQSAPQEVIEQALNWIEQQIRNQRDASPAVKAALKVRAPSTGR